MKLLKNTVLSFQILSAHKLRTVLSLTGIIVGVGAVILMTSVGRGAEKRIIDTIQNMGTNLIIVNAGQSRIIAGRQRQLATVTTLIPKDAEAILKNCPSVVLAAPATNKKLAARWETETSNTNVFGMTADGLSIRNITIGSGRVFDAMEDRARRRVAIVGPTVVENLFGGRDPVGFKFRLGRIPFEVIGVSSPKGTDINGVDQDDMIIVPLGTAMRRLFNVTHIQTIYLRAESTDLLDSAEAEIQEVLRKTHRLQNKPDDFTIQNQALLLETEGETVRSMTLLMGSVATLSLLIGGFGIFAVMLISVRERTQEIGLRRAVGALRQDIMVQFLIESGSLTAIGGLMGVLAGTGISLIVLLLDYWETVILWPAVLVAFGFSMIVGVLFGFYPAVKAANLEPIEALRAE